MLNLNDRKWKEFKVKQLFTLEKCKCSNVSLLKRGNVPYVGATTKNNGIIHFVEFKEKWITKGNCIAFICDGQGSVGLSIYKMENFVGSTTVKVGRNSYLNRYTGQFLVSALDKNRTIYSYGYKRNESRLKNEVIFLPVDEYGNPDYAFMEQYIKERESQLIKEYKEFIDKNTKLNETLKSLSFLKWKDFFIKDIFVTEQRKNKILQVPTGSNIKKAKLKNGNIPRITVTSQNNGVSGYYNKNDEVRQFENFISVSFLGDAFYHPYTASLDMKVHCLKLINKELNIYIAEFLIVLLKQNISKYNYGDQLSSTDLPYKKIMLPIDKQGNPDYFLMEQYGKRIMMQKYQQYFDYISTQKGI